jgi:hypothetical protein
MNVSQFFSGLLVVSLFIFGSSANCEEPTPKVYRIEMQITQTKANGEKVTVSAPTVVTLEKQEARVEIREKKLVVPEAGGEPIELLPGIFIAVTTYPLPDGKVNLEIKAEHAVLSGSDSLTVRGIHSVKTVPLGKTTKIPFPASEFEWKFKVTEQLESEAVIQYFRDTYCEFLEPKPRKTSSEDLRKLLDEWERFWHLDQPRHMKPFRTHGGIL